MPGQSVRKDSVRKKLNTIREEFQDKVVLIVDDSIVRQYLKKNSLNGQGSWSKKGVFRLLPPIIHPNVRYRYACKVRVRRMEGPLSKSLRLLEQTDDLIRNWMI